MSTWTALPRSFWNPISWDDADVDCPEILRCMINQTYAPLGGYIGASTLIEETDVQLVLNIADPQALIFGKTTPFGVKWVCAAARTIGARRSALVKLTELLNTEGNYAELSGALADLGFPRVLDPLVAARVLARPVLPKEDGRYVRACHGVEVEKVMVGRPRLSMREAA